MKMKIMDTIVLQISNENFKVVDPKKFKPYFQPINQYGLSGRINFLQEHRGFRKYIQNPPTSYRDEGLVFPNLRIDERIVRNNYLCALKISFSCPKLLWGQSFEEVNTTHFTQVVDTLVARLFDMGIVISNKTITNAPVHTLHYAKNIMFPSGEDTRIFLNRLSKVSVNAWFENNTKNFSNGGKTVRFHTDIFEIVFYLKYYDVLEPANRSVGRKTTKQEKELAKKLLRQGQIPPVVRMEIRFNGKRSIRNHLKAALGIEKQEWTFQEVFDEIKSLKAQKYYWDKILNDPVNRAYLSTTSDEDIFEKVFEKYPNESIKTISESMGLFGFIKNGNAKRLKAITLLRQNRKAWYDKRKKIISFVNEFVKQDENLIKIVTSVLENKPLQMGLKLGGGIEAIGGKEFYDEEGEL